MEHKSSVLKITLHGHTVGTTPRTIEAPFTEEHFTSVDEALEALGDVAALKHINFSHNLNRRADQRALMLKRNSAGIGTPRKPRASKPVRKSVVDEVMVEREWKAEVRGALQELVNDGLVEFNPSTGTIKLKDGGKS